MGGVKFKTIGTQNYEKTDAGKGENEEEGSIGEWGEVDGAAFWRKVEV